MKNREAFGEFQELLLQWNREFNLTSITHPVEIETKHFADSLTLLEHLPADARTLIDIGSGAGFPGIPIAIERPEISVTLLEATFKKTEFHRHVIEALKLDNLVTVHGRAEEQGHNPALREQFDVAVARAVALLPVLLEYVLPFVKVGGYVIAQKAAATAQGTVEDEIRSSEHALSELGGAFEKTIPLENNRCLVFVKKIKRTPERYPRLPGAPSKKPL